MLLDIALKSEHANDGRGSDNHAYQHIRGFERREPPPS